EDIKPTSGTTDQPVAVRAWPHRAGVPPGRRRRSQEPPTPSRSAHFHCPTRPPTTGTPQRRAQTSRGRPPDGRVRVRLARTNPARTRPRPRRHRRARGRGCGPCVLVRVLLAYTTAQPPL